MIPKVSVNVCVYNSERFIAETIESVLSQTYKEFELVIIDDGSTDKSGEILRSYAERHPDKINLVFQQNTGVAQARNNAINASKGEYIALLDHDDVWLPEKLERQMDFLEKNPHIPLVYSNGYFINSGGQIIGEIFKKLKPFRGKVLEKLLLETPIPLSSVVMKRSVFNEIGYFNPLFSIAEEYDLFLKLTAQYEIDYIEKPLIKYRLHEGNCSKNYDIRYNEVFQIFNCWLQHAEKTKAGFKDTLKRALLKENLKCVTFELIQNRDFARALNYFREVLPLVNIPIHRLSYFILLFYFSNLKNNTPFYIRKFFVALRRK